MTLNLKHAIVAYAHHGARNMGIQVDNHARQEQLILQRLYPNIYL